MGKASRKRKVSADKDRVKIGGHRESSGDSKKRRTQDGLRQPASTKNPAGRLLSPKYYIAISVSLLTFLLYLSSLQNDFVAWDDGRYVFENPYIRSFDSAFLKWAFFGFYTANWHPLTWISHALDYAMWGLNPVGHHLINIILHAMNTFIVVVLVTKLMETWQRTRNNEVSTFLNHRAILLTGGVTGFLFGVHPLHVESVAWVAERKDLLCAFFFLLSIIAYTKYANVLDIKGEQGDSAQRFFNRWYLLSLGFFILSLLSKPMAVSLPLVLLILDWYPFHRILSLKTFRAALGEKVPFILLSLFSSILTVSAQRAGGAMTLMKLVSLPDRLMVAAHSLMSYLWKMALPLTLSPVYPYPDAESLLSFKYFLSIILIIIITVIAIVNINRRKLFLSVWGYYVLTLIPVLGIVQVGQQSMADRYTYLPSLGPFFVIGLLVTWFWGKTNRLRKWGLGVKILSTLIVSSMVVSIAFLSLKQIRIWRNTISFWDHVIENETAPIPLARAYYNRAATIEKKGLVDEAIQDYNRAIALNPSYYEALNNLGYAFLNKGWIDKGIEQFQIALKINPDYAEAHNNLGLAFVNKGWLDKAVEQWQIAVKLNPNSSEAHNNLGLAFINKGMLDKAVEQCQIALKLNPDNAEAYNNLGLAFINKGWTDKAIEQYQIALKLNPSHVNARKNMMSAYELKSSAPKPAMDR